MSNELLDNIDYSMIIDDNEDNLQIVFALKKKKEEIRIIFKFIS